MDADEGGEDEDAVRGLYRPNGDHSIYVVLRRVRNGANAVNSWFWKGTATWEDELEPPAWDLSLTGSAEDPGSEEYRELPQRSSSSGAVVEEGCK